MKALNEQTLYPRLEIICIDSGSTDGTVELLKNYPVKIIEIKAGEFNHGATRNMGVQEAQGEFVIMTVQDALPVDNKWVEKLLEGFTDETVAAVCGQQVVPHHRDKNPAQWFRPVSSGSVKKYRFSSADEFDALSPEEKKNICGWDDVTACYRKDILLKLPFRKVIFAEDAIWAMDALRAGYAIVYNTFARVYHYHHETPEFAFKRSLTVFYFRYKYFRYLPGQISNTLRGKAQLLKLLLKTNIPVKEKIYWWKYNCNYQRASESAFQLFSKAVNKGDAAVDALHEKYCSIAPIGKQKESV